MNILWISNILLPDISKHLGIEVSFAGGWMFSSLSAIKQQNQKNKYSVLCFHNSVNNLVKQEINGIIYYVMPVFKKKNHCSNIKYCKQIANDFNPHLVHIHGTEQTNAFYFFQANASLKYVVSIQGLLTVYSSFYLSGLNLLRLIKYTSIYELLKKNSLFAGQYSYTQKGVTELSYLKNIKNFIGRTDWDKAHVWAVNPNANYFFCNETLRPSFYKKKWTYKNCEPYSIFVSQAKNPIKGFHQLLKALPLIIRHYPQTKVYVGSSMNLYPKTLKDKIKMSSYAKYLNYLIRKNNLKGRVIGFDGLTEEDMCNQYLKSNVFVSCSSIENSPNSVGEAQLLGVPTISSYVGGIGNMIEHAKSGYIYRFDDPILLAHLVCQIFAGNYPPSLLVEEQKTATIRHDPQVNAKRLLEIYSKIAN